MRGLSQLLGSHALVALVGWSTLPFLTRALGPERYGGFSLFLTLLGVVTYQDFVRPLFVREGAVGDARALRRLEPLSRVTSWILCVVAAALGAWLFETAYILPFALAVFAHATASIDYARWCAAGRVGAAGCVRNVAWAAALFVATALAFVAADGATLTWPFAVANVAIALVYRTGRSRELVAARADIRRGLWPTRRARARARSAWNTHRTAILALLGFGLVGAVTAASDRVLLERFGTRAELGLYTACADLVLKLSIVGSALASILQPRFARALVRDRAAAERDFVRIASTVLGTWFVLLTLLCSVREPLLHFVLGERYAGHTDLVALLFAGAFVHMLGYLVTPWQRARGTYGTATRTYAFACVAMLVVGCITIPSLGALGAALAYLTARGGDLVLALRELRSFSASALPRARVAFGCALVAGFVGFALHTAFAAEPARVEAAHATSVPHASVGTQIGTR